MKHEVISLEKFISKTLNNEENNTDEKQYIKKLKKDYRIKLKNPSLNNIFIDGDWASGKTYYAKEILTPVLKNSGYECVYTSLFGINSIDEIQIKLFNKYKSFKYNKYKSFKYIYAYMFWIAIICIFSPMVLNFFKIFGIDWKDYIYSFKFIKLLRYYFSPFYKSVLFICFSAIALKCIFGIKFKTFIQCFDNQNLGTDIPLSKAPLSELFETKKHILIFDDLERISSNAKMEEILGYINDLQETSGFNIIILLNKNEINTQESEDKNKITNLYKKINFINFTCEFTKKRYEYLKEYCLDYENISYIDRKEYENNIDEMIKYIIPNNQENGKIGNIYDLRIYKNIILSIIRINKFIKYDDFYKYMINEQEILEMYKNKDFDKGKKRIFSYNIYFENMYEMLKCYISYTEKFEENLFKIDLKKLPHIEKDDVDKLFKYSIITFLLKYEIKWTHSTHQRDSYINTIYKLKENISEFYKNNRSYKSIKRLCDNIEYLLKTNTKKEYLKKLNSIIENYMFSSSSLFKTFRTFKENSGHPLLYKKLKQYIKEMGRNKWNSYLHDLMETTYDPNGNDADTRFFINEFIRLKNGKSK